MVVVTIGLTPFMALPSYARDSGEIRFNRFYFDDLTTRIPPEQIASNIDIWDGHYDVLRVGAEVKKINPDVKLFLYRNLRAVWNENHTEYNAEELELFKQNDWILKDSTGNYVRDGDVGFLVDVGNPDYRAWVANWYKSYAIAYNVSGVWLDNCLASREMLWGPIIGAPINPRTGFEWTDQEFFDAVVTIVNTVKSTLGPNICVMGNGIFNGNNWVWREAWYHSLLLNSSLDGIMSEAWVGNHTTSEWDKEQWDNETVWLRSMDMAVWINKNFLSKGNKLFITLMLNAARNEVPDGNNEKYALYTYASMLLAAYNDGNSLGYGSYFLNQQLQNLFKTNVGVPLTEYTIIPNTHVYSREFSLAKVYVNPSDKEYLVDGFSMKPYSGKIVTHEQSTEVPEYSVSEGEILYITLIIALVSILAVGLSFFLRYRNSSIYCGYH